MKLKRFLLNILLISCVLCGGIAFSQENNKTNLMNAAKDGNLHAIYTLGANYYELKRYDEALALFEKGAKKGNIPCINALAVMYSNGQGVKINYNKAIELLKLIAEQGDSIAMSNLSETYAELLDFKQSIEWQLKASTHLTDSINFPAENIKVLGLIMDSSTIKDLENLSLDYIITFIKEDINYKIFSIKPKNIQLNNNQENLFFFDKNNTLKTIKVSISFSELIINLKNLDTVFSKCYTKINQNTDLYRYQVGEQYIEIKEFPKLSKITINYYSSENP